MTNLRYLGDVGVRAVKTFVQTFLAVLAGSGTGFVHVSTLRTAAIAAGAAAISALQNVLTTPALAPIPTPAPVPAPTPVAAARSVTPEPQTITLQLLPATPATPVQVSPPAAPVSTS